jgi:O-antigen ligase
MRIWDQLERTYARAPLGIGPGNSGALTLSIAERERPDSYRSKEAHSDYLAYAIERGPLGIAGLVAFTVVLYVQVTTYWRHRPHRGVGRRRYSRWAAAMAAILTASAMHSTVIEKLHFRHFWLFVAMVAASAMVAAKRAQRRPEVVEATPMPVTMRPALTSGPRGRLLARGMAS